MPKMPKKELESTVAKRPFDPIPSSAGIGG
jgi:hypothetical protein